MPYTGCSLAKLRQTENWFAKWERVPMNCANRTRRHGIAEFGQAATGIRHIRDRPVPRPGSPEVPVSNHPEILLGRVTDSSRGRRSHRISCYLYTRFLYALSR